MSDPAVKIVSLTVTEKGYCHNPATGRLNHDHPDVLHDIADLSNPRSAPGFIVAALAARKAAGVKPFTVLSCDNLPSNGRLTGSVIVELAALIDPDLSAWIDQNVTFPSTMVDRITPATTPEDVDKLLRAEGYHDPACVVHEPFRQWVVEDNFVQGHPAWETVGASLVKDVDAHELMKLRCLNGTHSTLAYLGYLAGYETIAETVADPAFASLCEKLWVEEIVPTIPQPEGEDLTAYCAALLERYRNPAIRHRTWQIAMDGSQKMPQRILGTIQDNLSGGTMPKGLILAVAGWMRYVGGVDETGAAIDVRDPLAERLKAISDKTDDPAARVEAYLAVDEVFDPELAGNADFRAAVIEAYTAIAASGVKPIVEGFVA
jgi:fructuronate reductase